ncbi:MAG: PKD domain-containing protein [Saprospiraceae bacterium]|nr:PKD domain-containing protein [Saprospiraceae bacterium]
MSATLSAQVTADFDADTRSGCLFIQTSFTDLSTSTAGKIVAWNWEIGNSTVTVQNPSRIFGQPGRYRVCLTVTDDKGNSDTKCVDDFITVYEGINPFFTISDSLICKGQQVNIVDGSTSPNGRIVEWTWELAGDIGSTKLNASQNFVNTYNVPGTFDLALTIKDDKGCTESYNVKKGIHVVGTAQVQVKPDVAAFCTVPHTTSFKLTKFDSTASYFWDFDNGRTYTGTTPPAITFTEARSYNVRIASSNTIGCSDTLTLKGLIHPIHRVDAAASDSAGCAPLKVRFSDRSQLRADSIYWDFGDGTTSDRPNVDHTFVVGGTYPVRLFRLVNGCWLPNENPLMVKVRDQPKALFTLDDTRGCQFPFELHPVNLSVHANNYSWRINGTEMSADPDPNLVLDQSGNFNVELIATDTFGCADTAVAGPVVLYDWQAVISDSIVGCIPLNAHLEDLTQGLDPSVRWRWEITGDTSFTRTSRSLDWNIKRDGVYDVKFVVENNIGCIDSLILPGYVQGGELPDVDFSIFPDTVCIKDTVYLQDLSDDRVNGWSWTFSDGQQSEEQDPKVIFKDPGNIGITLTASYNGCTSSRAKPKGVVVQDPKADFTYRFNCGDGSIQFTNQSKGYDSLFWDFGVPNRVDDTSSLANPVIQFPPGETYYVELQAFNKKSLCSDHKRIPIYVGDPSIQFGMVRDSGCIPFNLIIPNASQDLKNIEVVANGAGNVQINSSRIVVPYRKPGKYAPVEAMIVDRNGCADTLQLTDSIAVNQATSILQLDRSEVCLQDTVRINDLSTSYFSTIAERRLWADQTPLPDSSNIYVPQLAGAHTLSLFARDGWGCEDSVSVVLNVNQVAGSFELDSLSCSSRAVQLTAITPVNPVDITWNLGNGEIRHEPSFTYSFPDSGTFTVTLHLEDTVGCVGEYANTIRIDNPVAAFAMDTDYYYCPPYETDFYNLSSGATDFTWSFGDKTSDSKAFGPTHIYTQPGVYSIRLIADLIPGCSDTSTHVSALTIGGPTGTLERTIDSTCAPTRVQFDLVLNDQYDVFWDAGEGTIDSINAVRDSLTFEYVYQNAGNYAPTILIRDTFGCLLPFTTPPIPVNELSIKIDIPTIDFCDSLNPIVQLYNLSYSNHQIRDFNWQLIHPDTTISTNAFETSFYLPKVGRYDVQVTAADGFCHDTLFLPGYIKVGPKPVNQWLFPDTIACAPYPLEVANQTVLPEGFIDSTLWILNGDTINYRRNLDYPLDGGQYQLVMVNVTNAGCRDTIEGHLTLKESAPTGLPDAIHLCYRDSVLLRDSLWQPVNRYVWNFPDGSECPDCDSLWYRPDQDGRVMLQVTNPNDCITTDSVLVYFGKDSIPDISIQGDTVLCPDEITQLTLNRPFTNFHIQWDSLVPGLNCYQECYNPVLAPLTSAWHTVTLTSDFGCSASDSIYIRVLPRTSGILGQDVEICQGDSIQLQVLKGQNPYWHISDQLSCTYCPDPVAFPDTTRKYLVGIIDSLGCNAFDSLIVRVLRLDELAVTPDTVICRGATLTLAGTGPQPVQWLPAPHVIGQGNGTQEVMPDRDTYYGYAITSTGCQLTDSVLVQVTDRVPFRLIGDTVCAGDTAMVRIDGLVDDVVWPSYINRLGNEMGWFIANQQTTVEATGSIKGCLDSTTSTQVKVIDVPQPGYPPSIIWLQDAVQIEPLKLDPNWTYAWSPPDGLSCVDCPSPSANPLQEQLYQVLVTDPSTGCTNLVAVQIGQLAACADDLVVVPNVFSPNGDGRNDVLYLYSKLPSITSFEVFNRWGSRLFQTSDINEGWDGRLGGYLQPPGVYAFRVTYFCPAVQREVTVSGDVTLVR